MHPNDTTPYKVCSKCGESKPATSEYFKRDKSVRDGLRASCKVCCRAWYEANKERASQLGRTWRETNRDRKASTDRAYREGNKARIAEANRAYREANKEKIAERQHAYHEVNKERIAERGRAWTKANRERKRITNRAWRMANKDREKKRLSVWRMANQESERERHRIYRAVNKERMHEAHRAWLEAHPGYSATYYVATKERFKERNRIYREANKQRRLETNRAWRMANKEKRRVVQLRRNASKRNAEGTHTAKDIQRQYDAQKGKCYYCGVKVGDIYHVDHVVPLARGGTNWPENLVIACPTCNTSKQDRMPHEWPQGGRLL